MGWACWQVWELAAPAVEGWVERGHWTGKEFRPGTHYVDLTHDVTFSASHLHRGVFDLGS
jgi:hypothetical protein